MIGICQIKHKHCALVGKVVSPGVPVNHSGPAIHVYWNWTVDKWMAGYGSLVFTVGVRVYR